MEWNQAFVKAPEALALLPTDGEGRVDWGRPGDPGAAKVALMDTGYWHHGALGFSNGAGSPFLHVDEGRDCLRSGDHPPRDPLNRRIVMDPGHGTRTTTALCGDAPGFQGIAPRLPVVPFRVTDHSLLTKRSATAIAKALNIVTERVLEGSMAPIVNISLGKPLGNEALGRAVDKAYEAGVIIVCAAGQLIEQVVYPAKHRRTIAVAGIKRIRDDKYQIYEQYKTYERIDAWAPAGPVRRGNVESDAYQNGHGTSYACLHVTAAAAMWWRYKSAEILEAYGHTWERVEAFRLLLLRKPSRTAPTQDAALRLGHTEVRHLQKRANRGRMVNCLRLLEDELPKADHLLEQAELAVNDEA